MGWLPVSVEKAMVSLSILLKELCRTGRNTWSQYCNTDHMVRERKGKTANEIPDGFFPHSGFSNVSISLVFKDGEKFSSGS